MAVASGGRGQPSVSDDLRELLAFNPTFRLVSPTATATSSRLTR